VLYCARAGLYHITTALEQLPLDVREHKKPGGASHVCMSNKYVRHYSLPLDGPGIPNFLVLSTLSAGLGLS
jgi:hypothetical protein